MIGDDDDDLTEVVESCLSTALELLRQGRLDESFAVVVQSKAK